MTETQVRFLRAIAETVAAHRVVEVHLFAARRQGPVETGVAVVAAQQEVPVPAGELAADALALGAPAGDERAADATPAEVADAPEQAPLPGEEASPDRLVVYCARYRHTIKGLDRGKWEFDCVAQADAPLVTVDAVVRGVMDRAGDAGDPERLGAEQWCAALEEPSWAAPA